MSTGHPSIVSRLHARLERRFDLITEAVPVGPLRVQFTRVADPEKVLDDLCDRIDTHERLTGERISGDQLGLPYWAELWDSAIGVGQWMVERSDRWRQHKGFSVLDLGCGMGLSGTVAALLGAQVLFADIQPECLLFARLNGVRYSASVRARRVDWQRDDLGRTFDLIVGSDVLYDRTQWTHLDTFFRTHLAPGGLVLLGEPGRMSGELFVPWVRERGWQFHESKQSVPTRSTPIRLFELTR